MDTLIGIISVKDGLVGMMSVAGEVIYPEGTYEGSYEVLPAITSQSLPTAHKTLSQNINVLGIPSYETSNPKGITFIIGGSI